jgi:hypothetical protein
MSNTFESYQAEIQYRSNKIRNSFSRSRRVRTPFVRRPAEASRSSR